MIHKRMMVFGHGPNIEMFEFQHVQQHGPQPLYDIGFIHISFYIENDTFEDVLECMKHPLSKLHTNTKCEDTEGNKTVYIERHEEVYSNFKHYLKVFIILVIVKRRSLFLKAIMNDKFHLPIY
ncbi:hypothetical protein ACUXIR_000241 [Staphylococcus hominis]